MINEYAQALKRKLLGDVCLSREFYVYLLTFSFYNLGTVLSGMFVNIFLLKTQDSITPVLLYNIFIYAFVPVGFVAAGIMGKLKNLSMQIRLGIIFINVMYIILVLLGARAAAFVIPLGILNGFSQGLYFLAHVMMIMEFTDNSTIDASLSLITIMSNIIGVVMPLAAGLIIGALAGTAGYITVFCISLLFFITASVISFKIPIVKTEPGINYKTVLKLYFTNKNWIFLGSSDFLRGVREGVMGFLLSILLFQAIKSEMLIGVNSFSCSIISLLAFMYLTSRLTPQNRLRSFLFAAVCAAVSSLLLFLGINVYTIFIFSIISSLAVMVMQNVSSAIGLTFISRQEAVKKRRIESVTVRESFINSGRVLGIALLFFINVEHSPLIATLFVASLYLLQIINWTFLRRI